MRKFWAHMHVGHTSEFVGDSWDEAGFSVDEDGNPTRDGRNNTVAGYSVDPVTVDDAGLIRDAYAGDGAAIGDRAAFLAWLEEEGLDADDRRTLVKRFAEEMTEPCADCGRAVPYRDPEDPTSGSVPAADDDAAWKELADEHEPDCEWITTRAHRLEAAP